MLFALTVPANADYALGWIIVGSIPAVHFPYGIGAFLILLSEALVLKYFFNLRWFHAVLASIGLNIISTLAGLFVGMFVSQAGAYSAGTSALILLVVILVLSILNIKTIPWPLILICLLLAFVGFYTGAASSMELSVDEPFWVKLFLYAFPMLLAFALSVLIESLFGKAFIRKDTTWNGILRANIISYVILAGLMLIWGGNIDLSYYFRSRPFDSITKVRLRQFASAQIAYQAEHGVYGTFDELMDEELLPIRNDESVTQESVLELYSLDWDFRNLSIVTAEGFPWNSPNTFTIIAYPDERALDGGLRTFGITDDGITRIYDPDKGNEFYSVRTWDTVL